MPDEVFDLVHNLVSLCKSDSIVAIGGTMLATELAEWEKNWQFDRAQWFSALSSPDEYVGFLELSKVARSPDELITSATLMRTPLDSAIVMLTYYMDLRDAGLHWAAKSLRQAVAAALTKRSADLVAKRAFL